MYRIFTMKRLAANAMANLSFTMLMVSIAAVLVLILGAGYPDMARHFP